MSHARHQRADAPTKAKRRPDGTKARWKKSERDLRDRSQRPARPDSADRRRDRSRDQVRDERRPTSRPSAARATERPRAGVRAPGRRDEVRDVRTYGRREDSHGGTKRAASRGWEGPMEGPRGQGRPGSDRDDRPRRDERPRFENGRREDRPHREDVRRDERPRFEDRRRDDRPRREDVRRDERPRFEDRRREDRPRRDERPRREDVRRDERPRFEDRRFEDRRRDDRPRRTDRRRDDRPRRERPTPVIPPLTGPNAFVDLGVPTDFAAVLATSEITEPTPIQDLTIPAALSGRDVLGRGRTGSGKTLSFGLPMLTRLAHPRGLRRQPRGLVLAPTRELAMQVADALRPIAAVRGLRLQLVIGGSSYERQIRGLISADIVVATPGRLVDLAGQEAVDLSAVEMFVLDEADHMADLGFMDEIDRILGQLSPNAQGLLFSATLDADVDRLVRTYLHDPIEHNADPATASVGTMAHHVVLVHPKDKDAVTADIARRRGRTVAFVRTQLGAERLAGQLEDEGVRVAALHGGMKQGARTRTLSDFRAGAIDVLVATDVAARGIHVDDVDLVLHVDPPHGPKEYLHRSGRTARAGSSGTVVSLATLRQQRMVHAITAKAGVSPDVLRARPGDDALRDLVG